MDLTIRFTRDRLEEFADEMRTISNQIGFKVSARGWGYLLSIQVTDRPVSSFGQPHAASNTCKWVPRHESTVDTECGHVFNNYPYSGIGNAKESYAGDNYFRFCQYCGRKIEVVES